MPCSTPPGGLEWDRHVAFIAREAELRREVRDAVARALPAVTLVEGDLVSERVYGDGAPYYLLTVHLAEPPSPKVAAALVLHPGALVCVAVGGRVVARGFVPSRAAETVAQGGGQKEPDPR